MHRNLFSFYYHVLLTCRSFIITVFLFCTISTNCSLADCASDLAFVDNWARYVNLLTYLWPIGVCIYCEFRGTSMRKSLKSLNTVCTLSVLSKAEPVVCVTSWTLLLYKMVMFCHTRYRALGPELIPVYRQSASRWTCEF